MDRPALTLEEFAAMAAQIDAGAPRDQALEAAGIPLEAWSTTQALWLARMAEGAAQGRFALSAKYAELYEKHRRLAGRKKHGERRPLEGPLPLPPASVVPPLLVMDRLVRAPGQPLAPLRPAPSSLPPAPQATAPATTLSVQEFAMLRVDLAVAPPGEHPGLRAQYGLDEAAWHREETAWHARLTADERLRQEYLSQFRYLRGLKGPR